MNAVHAAQEQGRQFGVALQRFDFELEPLGLHSIERGELVELLHPLVILLDFFGQLLQIAFEQELIFGIDCIFLVFEFFVQAGYHH